MSLYWYARASPHKYNCEKRRGAKQIRSLLAERERADWNLGEESKNDSRKKERESQFSRLQIF